MTIELTALLVLTLLAASLWIPFIIGVNIVPPAEDAPNPFVVPPNPLEMKPWIARAYRAHQNLLEQFVPFAAVVIIAHLVEVSTTTTQWLAILFVALRAAHAIGMITGAARMPIRPFIFTSAYIVILVLIMQVFMHA